MEDDETPLATDRSTSSDISGCYWDCLALLKNLLEFLNQYLSATASFEETRISKLLEQYGRLRTWGEETRAALPAASRGSLDDVLRKDDNLKATVSGILAKIQRQISHALQTALTAQGIESANLANYLLESIDSDEESDLSSEEEEDEDDSTRPHFLLRQLSLIILHIEDDIASLYQVSLMITRPGFNRRYVHSNTKTDVDPRVSHYEEFDVRHMEDKIRSWREHKFVDGNEPISTPEVVEDRISSSDIPPDTRFLVHRLGKANTRRREQLLHWSRHPDKTPNVTGLDTGNEPGFGHPVDSQAQQTRLPDALFRKTDNQSHDAKSTTTKNTYSTVVISDIFGAQTVAGPVRTVYAESTVGNKRTNRIPALPKVASKAESFECPYCHLILDSRLMRNRTEWKRHVFRDLRPYVCTFQECQNEDKQYQTRRDWIYHETQMHRRQWVCEEHRIGFPSKESFLQHVAELHSTISTQKQLSILVEMSERAGDGMEVVPCPLCPDNRRQMALHSHLAEHLESIALFVLPTIEDDTNNDDDPESLAGGKLSSQSSLASRSSSSYDDQMSEGSVSLLKHVPKEVKQCMKCFTTFVLDNPKCPTCGSTKWSLPSFICKDCPGEPRIRRDNFARHVSRMHTKFRKGFARADASPESLLSCRNCRREKIYWHEGAILSHFRHYHVHPGSKNHKARAGEDISEKQYGDNISDEEIMRFWTKEVEVENPEYVGPLRSINYWSNIKEDAQWDQQQSQGPSIDSNHNATHKPAKASDPNKALDDDESQIGDLDPQDRATLADAERGLDAWGSMMDTMRAMRSSEDPSGNITIEEKIDAASSPPSWDGKFAGVPDYFAEKSDAAEASTNQPDPGFTPTEDSNPNMQETSDVDEQSQSRFNPFAESQLKGSGLPFFQRKLARELPTCERSIPSYEYEGWYFTEDEISSFYVCPQCYEGAFMYTQFYDDFKLTPLPYYGRCFFSDPWVRIAWLLTLKRDVVSLELLTSLSRIEQVSKPCPDIANFLPGSSVWTFNPLGGSPAKDSLLCNRDRQYVQTLFPTLKNFVIPLAPYPTEEVLHCRLRVSSRRFPKYLDLIIELDDEARLKNEVPDMEKIIDMAARHASTPECPRSDLSRRRLWYWMPEILEFTVCEECFEEVVMPYIASSRQSNLAWRFNKERRVSPLETSNVGLTCCLYSERMRKIWTESVESDTIEYLKEHAVKRRETLVRMTELIKERAQPKKDPLFLHLAASDAPSSEELDNVEKEWRLLE